MAISNINIDKKINDRVTGLDLYRIIACMLVVINHCNSKVMIQVTPQSLAWYATVLVFYVTKIAVPGFLMIAGFNLLHRDDDWKRTWERAKRILIVMLVFSFVYYVWRLFISGWYAQNSFGIKTIGLFIWNFVNRFVHDDITDAFWYLYMYLALMIILPFLQKLVKNMEKKDYHIFFLLALVFMCIIPMLGEFVPFFKLSESFNFPIVRTYCGSVAYMIVGHYFYQYVNIEEKNIRRQYICVAVFAGGLLLNMIFTGINFAMTGGESFLDVGEIEYLPLMAQSVAMFTFLLGIQYKQNVRGIIENIGILTFGIYLVSDFMCAVTHFVYYNLCRYMNRLFAVAIQDVVVLVISAGFIWAIRNIKIVRKYI